MIRCRLQQRIVLYPLPRSAASIVKTKTALASNGLFSAAVNTLSGAYRYLFAVSHALVQCHKLCRSVRAFLRAAAYVVVGGEESPRGLHRRNTQRMRRIGVIRL